MRFRTIAVEYIKKLGIKRLEWIRLRWGYNGLKYDELRQFLCLLDLHISDQGAAAFILKHKKIIRMLPSGKDEENKACIERMFIVAEKEAKKPTTPKPLTLI
jgi:hypothetical protein